MNHRPLYLDNVTQELQIIFQKDDVINQFVTSFIEPIGVLEITKGTHLSLMKDW